MQKLLSKDSHNKFLVGDRTFLFWASSQSDGAKELEELTYSFFDMLMKKTDDPNKRIEKVKKVFNSIYSGTISSDLDDKFYILGLVYRCQNCSGILGRNFERLCISYIKSLCGYGFD